jgi:hypothetical protein
MARSRKTKNGATKGFLKALNAMPLSKPAEPMTNKLEWKPIKPIQDAPYFHAAIYKAEVNAQLKLLEYLLETTSAPYLIMADRIKSMLKQIQEAQK